MNTIKPIKPFKTLEDEAAFWDKHDVSLLMEDPSVKLETLPELEKEKEAVITIRLQASVKRHLEQRARVKGINVSTLSRMWLIDRLQLP